jgi:hypothetical protein
MIEVKKIPVEMWREIAEEAHLVVFNETRLNEQNRIDFALMAVDEKPLQYVTCRELDNETLYWQYGGAFPSCKGTPKSFAAYKAIIEACKNLGYKRISFLVENNNFPMLKFALAVECNIVGMRTFQGSVWLEHLKEFKEE